MHNKSFNLENKLSRTNFNFVKNFKYFIIAPLCIILAGLILIFTINFNRGIDFTGGSIATIYLGDEISYQQAVEKIEEVLNEQGLTPSLFQQVEMQGSQYINVKFQNANFEQNNQTIRQKLFEKFGYDIDEQANFVEINQFDGSAGNQNLINAFISILVASLVICLYLFLRHGIPVGMSSLLCVYHDILITISIVAITRLEINITFIAALISVLAYSFIGTIMFFDKIKANKDENTIRNSEIANITVKQNLYPSLIITWYVILILAIFSTIGVSNILPFAIPMMIGVLANFYSTNFLAPALWSFSYVRKAKKIKEKEQEDEII